MNCKIINEDEVKNLFTQWGKFASVCYDTKTENYDKIGFHCLKSGHFSGSRSQYINFIIEDCPRAILDQLVRHEQGVCKNVQSFRYVDKNSFAYEIPKEIVDNDVLIKKYHSHMMNTLSLYSEIQDYVKNKTNSQERANEQARYVLPMATHSSVAIGFTVEAFIHLCNVRLCNRTEDVHRQLVKMMRDKVVEILPELEDYLAPKCVTAGYCEETHGCGMVVRKGVSI